MSGQHFEVGEVAYNVRWKCNVTVTSGIENRKLRHVHYGYIFEAACYHVDRHDGEPIPFGRGWVARPEDLRKLKPPDLKVTRWDECPWQPSKADISCAPLADCDEAIVVGGQHP